MSCNMTYFPGGSSGSSIINSNSENWVSANFRHGDVSSIRVILRCQRQ